MASYGSYQPLERTPSDCYVYLREHSEVRYLVALNLSDTEQTLTLTLLGSGSITPSTHLDREGDVDLASLCLRSNEGCIIAVGRG